MTDLDKQEFKMLMVGIGEVYSKEITKPLMKIYFSSLADYSIGQIQEGFNKHVMDSKHGTFFPKPADIVRHLKAEEPSTEQKAELAWAQVMRTIRTDGSYGSLKLDDKQALAAVKAFTSWKDLCMMPESKMTWAKKEFISMYTTYENTPLEMLPSSLPGREELEQHKLENKQSVKSLIDGVNNYRAKLEDR